MTCDQIKAQLDSAQLAYHNLMTGMMPRVVVDQNGERVEFTATNAARLATYIAQLQAQYAACAGPGCAAALYTTPLQFTF